MTIPASSSTAKSNQLTSDQLELWKKTVSERLSEVFEPGTSGGTGDNFEGERTQGARLI